MKLLTSLTILLLTATSSLAALRGSIGSTRKLAAKSFIYLEYEGVCRKRSNGTGGGTAGRDYDKYTLDDEPNLSYRWCKDLCDSQSDCTGLEYSDTGSSSQCEVWTSDINVSSIQSVSCLLQHDTIHSLMHCLVPTYNRAMKSKTSTFA